MTPSPASDSTNTASTQSRARRRERRVLMASATALLAKIVSAATALLSLPLTLGYLGTERFGMWATISSAILVFNLADLGIGNGMLNRVSAAYARGDHEDIRRVTANAVALLLAIALGIITTMAVLYPFVPWHALFNVQSAQARAEAGPAVALFVVFWSLRLPLSIVQRVQFGIQRGHLSNAWDIAASIASLVAIVIATRFDAGVYWLVAAFAGVPALTLLANWAVFYGYQQPALRPNLLSAHITDALPVVKAGLLILTLQMSSALVVAADSFVIAQVLGAEAVAGFAVVEKMFSLIPVFVMVVAHSMWPAFAEASTRGDTAWIRRSLIRVLTYALVVSTSLSIFLVFFGADIIAIWIRKAVEPSAMLLVAFAIWKVLECLGSTSSIYLNARDKLRQQLLPALLFCGSAIALKFWLVARLGVSGAIWATIAAFAVFIVLPYIAIIRETLRDDRSSQQTAPR